jgi:hypothetical protein
MYSRVSLSVPAPHTRVWLLPAVRYTVHYTVWLSPSTPTASIADRKVPGLPTAYTERQAHPHHHNPLDILVEEESLLVWQLYRTPPLAAINCGGEGGVRIRQLHPPPVFQNLPSATLLLLTANFSTWPPPRPFYCMYPHWFYHHLGL